MDMEQIQTNNRDDAEGKEAPEGCTIPKAILTRMMRQAMPGNSKIGADAKEAMDQCVAEFAAVVMRAATQECRRDRRLTITGDDLIVGLRNIGFDDYAGPLTRYLRRYRESEGTMPRGRHTMMPPPPPAAATATVEAAEAQPLAQGLSLQLSPPLLGDVTELGLHTDVYAVWRGAARPPAGASQMPPADADGKFE
ncbi:unnamed protein product [Urochloa decumbens]|uniref:Transcription factor CBF/NF-Y/archaeal histone domain-containing protein n=1 Tax=Urochloa decumbens TaxID=240449 RepID=A0ABC9DGQ4_9POAL